MEGTNITSSSNLEDQMMRIKFQADMEVNKKAALADIELNTAKRKAELLADLHAKQQLKRMVLSCTADGSVILQHEGFGDKISGKLPLKIRAARCYSHIGDVQASALALIVEKENGEEASLFWDLGQVEDRHIRKVFERQGISFGFGDKKEKEIRRQILQMTRDIAKTYELPEEHGWYQIEDCWIYAFPEEITWKEVKELC